MEAQREGRVNMGEEVVVEVDPQPEGETPDVTVNEGDITVIVDDTSDDDSEGHSEELAVTVGRLVAEVEQLRSQVAGAQIAAEIAQETAEVAVVEAVEAEETAEGAGEFAEEVAEAAANPGDEDERADIAEEVEDTSDSILPNKKHWVHRSFRDWVGGDR